MVLKHSCNGVLNALKVCCSRLWWHGGNSRIVGSDTSCYVCNTYGPYDYVILQQGGLCAVMGCGMTELCFTA